MKSGSSFIFRVISCLRDGLLEIISTVGLAGLGLELNHASIVTVCVSILVHFITPEIRRFEDIFLLILVWTLSLKFESKRLIFILDHMYNFTQ